MSLDGARLFELLPAVHRRRDDAVAQTEGLPVGPLRALLDIVGETILALEENLDQLYDDQFIETCAEWVIPYIGDLVGYRPIRIGDVAQISRAEVANAIAVRRAKGTALGLLAVSRDVSGGDAAIVEYGRRLAITQPLNRLRPANGLADLRAARPAIDERGPFAPYARSAEMRGMAAGGRWNLRNVGSFVWDWRTCRRHDADPAPLDALRFRLDPLGRDLPILTDPLPPTGRLPGRDDLPRRLDRRTAAGSPETVARAVAVSVGGAPVEPLMICDLCDLPGDLWANLPSVGAALDPELGRLAFATPPAGEVLVSFAHAGSGLVGGGPWREAHDEAGATLDPVLVPTEVATLDAALALIADRPRAAIELVGNRRIGAPHVPSRITVPAGARWEIRASDGCWPVLLAETPIVLSGGANSALVLDGLCLSGAGLQVPETIDGADNGLAQLVIRDCTLVPGLSLSPAADPLSPGEPSLIAAGPALAVSIERSITGPLLTHADVTLRVQDSVVDAGLEAALAIGGNSDATAPAGPLAAFNATIRGTTRTALLTLASNCLFLGGLVADQRQAGIVRFSWLPARSRTPRRYRCVDDPAAAPSFQSFRLGTPGYARPAPGCPRAISEGADDGGEMGAFHAAHLPARRAALAQRLAENLPLGLDAGVFHVRDV